MVPKRVHASNTTDGIKNYEKEIQLKMAKRVYRVALQILIKKLSRPLDLVRFLSFNEDTVSNFLHKFTRPSRSAKF